MYGTIRDQLTSLNRRARVSNTRVVSINTKDEDSEREIPKIQENQNRSNSLADFDNKGNNLFSSPTANGDRDKERTKAQIQSKKFYNLFVWETFILRILIKPTTEYSSFILRLSNYTGILRETLVHEFSTSFENTALNYFAMIRNPSGADWRMNNLHFSSNSINQMKLYFKLYFTKNDTIQNDKMSFNEVL